MNDIKQIFSKNLNKLMEAHGENLTLLSDAINVPFSTVASWKHGEKMPRSGGLQKLADHYKVNLTYLTSNHEHSKLNSAAETVAAHIDEDTPEQEREQIINFIENLKRARK